MKISIVAGALMMLLLACEKDKEERVTLTKAELTAKQYVPFEGIYNNVYYRMPGWRDYTLLKFRNDNTLETTIRAGNYPTYYYLNDTTEYILDEVAARIIFPEVDTLIFGGTQKEPLYFADWVLEGKNDSMLFFRSEYTDTTRIGFYEATGHFILKRQ